MNKSITIWIGTADKENIQIGIDQNVWGSQTKKKIYTQSKKGDILVLKTGVKNGKPQIVIITEITGSSFESNENPWNDGNYLNMIPIKTIMKSIDNSKIYKLLQACINGDGFGKKHGFQNVHDLNVPIEYERLKPLFEQMNITTTENQIIEHNKSQQQSLKNYDGFIYAIKQNNNDNLFKIGFTKQSKVEKRLSQLQTGNPHKLVIVFEKKINDVKNTEKKIHTILDIFECRHNREWFNIDKVKLRNLLTELT